MRSGEINFAFSSLSKNRIDATMRRARHSLREFL
jgi:hypothetical protein